MSTDVTTGVRDVQQFDVGVNGPGNARSLVLISGMVDVHVNVSAPNGSGSKTKESLFFMIGPSLAPQQFLRATATANITFVELYGAGLFVWNVESVDADFDDESGRVRVGVDLTLMSNGAHVAGAGVTIHKMGFDARVLLSQ